MRRIIATIIVAFLLGSLAGVGISRLAPKPNPPPAVGVARYIAGLRAWDGHVVWASYSPDYQAQLTDEGSSEASTVSLYDNLRQQGASIDEVAYVGGYQTRTSGYFLYVTRHFVKDQEPTEVVWVFRTNTDGLIEEVK